MKKIIYILSITSFLFGAVSCKEEAFDQEEQYKQVLYLMSKDSYNVWPVTYTFKEKGEVTTGYLSIGCGGSLSNPKECIIDIETDTVLFDKYNKLNFDIDSAKYAKILPKDRYSIKTMSATLPANSTDQYVKIPIDVNIDGLSPDSTYFIPLAIKKVSNYEVNPEKSNVLYKICLKNEYADESEGTYYQMRGNTLNDKGEVIGSISSTKSVKPLSKNSVRMFVGNKLETSTSTVDDIAMQSIIVTVNENKELTIEPYGTIQIEQFSRVDNWNTYEEVKDTYSENKIKKYFYLHYRYRTFNPAKASWSDWTIVKESMYRVE
jgi:Domain of unknown function (DUF1735).